MNTVIYDGECPICTGLKDFSEHRLKHPITFIPYQNENITEVVPKEALEQLHQGLFFMAGDGKKYHGARAVFEIMSHMPALWGITGKILRIPPLGWISGRFYQWFARNRYQMGAWARKGHEQPSTAESLDQQE